MTSRSEHASAAMVSSVLPGFRPFEEMWSGTTPLYRSKAMARWAIRVLRRELADAEAMAIFRGHLYYHPERVAEVIQRDALARFRRRAGVQP